MKKLALLTFACGIYMLFMLLKEPVTPPPVTPTVPTEKLVSQSSDYMDCYERYKRDSILLELSIIETMRENDSLINIIKQRVNESKCKK